MATTQPLRQVVAALAAASLALGAGTATLPYAQAVEGTDENNRPPAVGAGNIDPNAQASLTIHKRLGTGGEAGDGSVIKQAPGENLPGVTFTVYKVKIKQVDEEGNESFVDVDFANNKHVAALADLTAQDVALTEDEAAQQGKNFLRGDSAATRETTATTNHVYLELPVGLYLVEETEAPADIAKSEPFLVSLPVQGTEVNGPNWNYHVHVYPKNQRAGVTKTVDDKDVQKGGELTYTVAGDIPAPASTGSVLSYYSLTDQVDPDQLEISETDWTSAFTVTIGDETLYGDTDYKVNPYNAEQYVNVAFTQAGREKLAANAGANVNLAITAKVLTDAGIIENDAQLTFDNRPNVNYDTEKDPPTPEYKDEDGTYKWPEGTEGVGSKRPTPGDGTTVVSDKVETYYGELVVTKTGDGQRLSGATFELYRATGDTPPTVEKGEVQGAKKVTVADQSDWTTDEEGTFTISGLHASDFEDNVGATGDYYLFEVAAPAGFTLPEGDERLTKFTASKDAITRDEQGNVKVQPWKVEIDNTRTTLPVLPLTGGAGIAIFAILALLLAGGAVALNANRNKAEAAA